MVCEICIHDIAQDALHNELRHVIKYFSDRGHEWCELVFGWHWGNDYPEGKPWEPLHVALAEVEAEIRVPEQAELGRFGHDDVTIRVPPEDCEFVFCHHQGVHLNASQPSHITEDFLARWAEAGFSPQIRDYDSLR